MHSTITTFLVADHLADLLAEARRERLAAAAARGPGVASRLRERARAAAAWRPWRPTRPSRPWPASTPPQARPGATGDAAC
jgi:uncharacterized protein YcaQ